MNKMTLVSATICLLQFAFLGCGDSEDPGGTNSAAATAPLSTCKAQLLTEGDLSMLTAEARLEIEKCHCLFGDVLISSQVVEDAFGNSTCTGADGQSFQDSFAGTEDALWIMYNLKVEDDPGKDSLCYELLVPLVNNPAQILRDSIRAQPDAYLEAGYGRCPETWALSCEQMKDKGYIRFYGSAWSEAQLRELYCQTGAIESK